MSDSETPWTAAHQAPLSFTQSPGLCASSCSLHQWCHPTISFSAAPFSSYPLSLPASGSFPMGQFFISGGQSTGASASASILPKHIQDWFSLGLTGLISLFSKGLSGVFSETTVWRHQFFGAHPSWWSQLSHPYMTTGKTTALTIWTFVRKVMSLLFNMLSVFAVAFFQEASVF